MGTADENYAYYNNIQDYLIKKHNDSLRVVVQDKISYYEKNTQLFLNDFKQYVKVNSKGISRLNVLTDEASTYSTRLYNQMSASLPLYKTIKDDLNNSFKLFVMGPGNYGKSTVINSLIGTGKKHAPENVKPLTWKIDIFEKKQSYSDVVLIDNNGKEQKLSVENAINKIDAEEKKIEESKKNILKKLKTLTKEKKLGINEIKELKIKMEREDVYQSNLVETRWGVTGSQLLEKFSIVDTPGLDQVNFSGEIKKNAIDYYHKSDGVIWVLDALTVNAKNSAQLLKDLEETLSKIGGAKASSNMIAVLNRMDLVSAVPGQAEEVIKEANNIFGSKFKAIIPYSALNSFESMKNADEDLQESSGRNQLLKAIHDVFYVNSNEIQANKKDEACHTYNAKNVRSLIDYQDQLSKDYNKLIDGIDKIRDNMNTELTALKEQFNRRVDNYLNEFKYGVEYHLTEASKIEDKTSQKNYLVSKVYKLNDMNSLAREFSSKARQAHETQAKKHIREVSFSQYKHLDKFRNYHVNMPDVAPIHLTELPDSYMPDMGVSAAVAGGAGLLLGPIGGLIGAGLGYLYSSEKRKEAMDDAVKTAEKLTRDLKTNYRIYVDNYYEQAYLDLTETISQSFASVYSIKAEEFHEITEAAATLYDYSEACYQNLDNSTEDFHYNAEKLLFG